MKIFSTFLIVLVLILTPLGSFGSLRIGNASAQPYYGYPTFSITSVVKDSSVKIKTYNLPPRDVFRVRMDLMGTRGVNGTVVDSFETGTGGTKLLEFSIPNALHGLYQISIRIESKTGSGYYAYNWFYNNTTAAKGSKPSTGYTGYPTFSIASVVRNQSVTINIVNLPPKDVFRVRMGYMGTRGVGGLLGKSFETGDGGSKQIKFSIPVELKGLRQIAVRIESKTGSGYFAYNWFYNNTYP